MNFQEELNAFINTLCCNADTDVYQRTPEYYQWIEKRDDFLKAPWTEEQKPLVEEILFEANEMAEQKAQVVYLQGYKDFAALLKNVGVL